MTQHQGSGASVPNHLPQRVIRLLALGGGVGLLLGASLIPGERTSEPCCQVISVDPNNGVVTAFERESGNRFSFTVRDKTLLAGIKPCQSFDAELAGLKDGQAFAADFGAASARTGAAGRAGVKPAAACCDMTSAPGTAGRVLGVQPHAKFEGVEIILTDLKRSSGDLVTANCLYCNGGSARVDLASDMRARVSDAKLLDTENQIEYRVEQPGGASGKPLVSDHGPGLKLQPNQAVKTWMKFTAPEGKTVTLVVPGASEPFEDLAIAAKQ